MEIMMLSLVNSVQTSAFLDSFLMRLDGF